ncbi:pyridoxal-phosphate dependent enzyme [Halomicrobium sp. IBSBa]|uniref:pyridoxal-phosphate dependent enzyme n=1 Tax=Halomicrobium sp. IBSBa TaxID=2778916 RepID=UPI001ABF4AD4|nr:pyridoxal-phosphate dependent enzyme [Halomicrobium sp. IBSBa]MBO4247552.1 pyridoxal-phosphate dependent enzyme [Halomicrobium sp. IBSBa]
MYHCEACGREYGPDGPWRCACGHALDYSERPLPDTDDPPDPATLDRDRGLWSFESFLPVDRHVSLGEGWTPLVDDAAFDAQLKLDSVFPTGSFKDRGATVTLSQADALGVERVVEDSSGNAGLAIATYAARAGIDAEIYVPADAKPTKLRKIERTGADVVRIEGTRGDVTDACHDALDEADAWYASHAWQPAFFAGTATWALEVAAQRNWTVPDAVVVPVGHGTLLLGAYRGFRALRAAGWTEQVPRLLGAQASGYAPIAAGQPASDGGTDDANEVADGIQIHRPARGDQLLDALAATGGTAVAVDAAATERAHDRLARAGYQVEPTCATAVAGLERFRAAGTITADEDVVVVLSGQNH